MQKDFYSSKEKIVIWNPMAISQSHRRFPMNDNELMVTISGLKSAGKEGDSIQCVRGIFFLFFEILNPS